MSSVYSDGTATTTSLFIETADMQYSVALEADVGLVVLKYSKYQMLGQRMILPYGSLLRVCDVIHE